MSTFRMSRAEIEAFDISAHFMMVALDENDKPAKVPRLILQTDDERLAWEHGEERRRIRIKRKQDKLDGI